MRRPIITINFSSIIILITVGPVTENLLELVQKRHPGIDLIIKEKEALIKLSINWINSEPQQVKTKG